MNVVNDTKVAYTSIDSIEVLTLGLKKLIDSKKGTTQGLVVICIGTDRSTGDALGPIVGTALQKVSIKAHVYGSLNNPVHAMNLAETMTMVKTKHPKCLVIAVDACLGNANSIGNIQAAVGPLRPGAGVNKDLGTVGDLHITGTVNAGGFMEYFVLQNTRLSLVMSIADVIIKSLIKSIGKKRKPKKTILKLAKKQIAVTV